MFAERNMPNKLKVLFTVEQLTVEDLVNWLKRTNLTLLLLGIYFLGLLLGAVFTTGESKTERVSQLLLYGLCSFFYLSACVVTFWFTRNPRAERVVFCLLTITALSLSNLAAAMLVIINAPVSGASAYTFFLLGFMSGCASIYIITKLKQKMLDDAMVAAGGYSSSCSYNIEHGDGAGVEGQDDRKSSIALSSSFVEKITNHTTTVQSPLGTKRGIAKASADIVYSSDKVTTKNVEK